MLCRYPEACENFMAAAKLEVDNGNKMAAEALEADCSRLHALAFDAL